MRVGASAYLNTRPLIYRLAERLRGAEFIVDLPSRLADRLAAGELDVAMIPAIECFQDLPHTIISDACIACRGPVLSVKLLSRVPIHEIRTLALDEGSRTSVALVQILLHHRYGLAPTLTTLPIGDAPGDADTDGVLLIGDRAIHAPRGVFLAEWDLGAEWCRVMGVPFVFALWAARRGVDTRQVASVITRARDEALGHLAEIAAASAPEVGLDPAACLSYLRDNLHFILGPRERQGLRLFLRHAADLGFVPRASRLADALGGAAS